MKFLILSCGGYPSKDNIYNSGFVHRRVTAYKNKGYKCKVFLPDKRLNNLEQYSFENVEVYMGNIDSLKKIIGDYNPDVFLIHFLNRIAMEVMKEINF